MKRNLVFFLSAFLLWSLNTFGQGVKYSNEFLSVGVGARALGMSNAVVASTNDIYSAYWNPAGLVNIQTERSLGLMHAEYFAGISKYDYGALGFKIKDHSYLAFSLVRFAVDNIPNTSELIDSEGNIHYDRITTFTSADYAFNISYARKAKTRGLSYGGNVKIIRRLAGDFGSSWGFGIDLAAQYKRDNWLFGAIARDVTTTFNAWSYELDDALREAFIRTGNTIPVNTNEITKPRLIAAAAYRIPMGQFSLLTEVDLDVTTDGKRNTLISSDPISVDPHLGLELSFKELVFLRGGVGNFQYETDENNKEFMSFQPNIGLGVKIRDVLTLDYALTDIGNQSLALYSNIFSIRFNFNRKNREASYDE